MGWKWWKKKPEIEPPLSPRGPPRTPKPLFPTIPLAEGHETIEKFVKGTMKMPEDVKYFPITTPKLILPPYEKDNHQSNNVKQPPKKTSANMRPIKSSSRSRPVRRGRFDRFFHGIYDRIADFGRSIGRRMRGVLRSMPSTRRGFGRILSRLTRFIRPMSLGNVLVVMTMLTIAKDGTMEFSGKLPIDGFENKTFTCEMNPFEESRFIGVSESKTFSIDGKTVAGGGCQLFKFNVPFLFIDIYDGTLHLGEGTKVKFQIPNFKGLGENVETFFSELLDGGKQNMNENLEEYLANFTEFDHYLGSTTNFELNVDEMKNTTHLKFAIENIGNFDFSLDAAELFDAENAFIGSYQ